MFNAQEHHLINISNLADYQEGDEGRKGDIRFGPSSLKPDAVGSHFKFSDIPFFLLSSISVA
jgi:hypothetical protein